MNEFYKVYFDGVDLYSSGNFVSKKLTTNLPMIIEEENNVEFLESQLSKLKKDLEYNIKCRTASKICAGVFSVLGPIVFVGMTGAVASTFVGVDAQTIVGTVDMSHFFVGVGVSSSVMFDAFVGYFCAHNPSNKEVNALAERVNYVASECLKAKTRLYELSKNDTEVVDNSVELGFHKVKNDKIKIFEEQLALRELYIMKHRKVLRLYKSGKLNEFLLENGFSDESIKLFIDYVEKGSESYLREYKKDLYYYEKEMNRPRFYPYSQAEIDDIHARGKLTQMDKVKEYEGFDLCAPGDAIGSAAPRCKKFQNCHDCLIDYVSDRKEYESVFSYLVPVNVFPDEDDEKKLEKSKKVN